MAHDPATHIHGADYERVDAAYFALYSRHHLVAAAPGGERLGRRRRQEIRDSDLRGDWFRHGNLLAFHRRSQLPVREY